jgi:hypothetical protein
MREYPDLGRRILGAAQGMGVAHIRGRVVLFEFAERGLVMRFRYEILDPQTRDLLACVTLFGDHDDDVEHCVKTMLSESIAICSARYETPEVIVRFVRVK